MTDKFITILVAMLFEIGSNPNIYNKQLNELSELLLNELPEKQRGEIIEVLLR